MAPLLVLPGKVRAELECQASSGYPFETCGLLIGDWADGRCRVVRQHAAGKGTTAIVLDGETMPYVDVTAAKMLVELSEDLERDGVRLYVAREIGQVRDVLRSADDAKHLARVFPTVAEAVQAALAEGTSSTPESAKSSETSS